MHAQHRMLVAGDSLSFPPFTTIQNYFYAWYRNGTFKPMMRTLRALGRKLADRSQTPIAAAVDTMSVKTTESGGPSDFNASKKVMGAASRVPLHDATNRKGYNKLKINNKIRFMN